MSVKREADFNQFLKVLKREGKPSHLPSYEHIASAGFISRRTGKNFNEMVPGSDEYVKTYVDFWIGMGFDCVPMERPLKFMLQVNKLDKGIVSHHSEQYVAIKNREDFEKFEWPDEAEPIDFYYFEKAAKFLPEGAKLVAGVGGGPYEWASRILGTIGMSYLLADDPELVEMVFEKIGKLHISANKILSQMDGIGAQRQGDDLGFKTSTFLRPELLRKLVFPTYKKMVSAAHSVNRPFILHSCGNLMDVYDDIIECGVDAKHSFEDVITPVYEFKKLFGDRITALGGLDVDYICRHSKEEIRNYTIDYIEKCFNDGYWAIGTGNSLTDYMPVENYMTVIETAHEVLG